MSGLNVVRLTGEKKSVVEALVTEFYLSGHESPKITRQVFKQLGILMTREAINNVLTTLPAFATGRALLAPAPILRAGAGILTPDALALLSDFETLPWLIGASRTKSPDKEPAELYLFNLKRQLGHRLGGKIDLSRVILIIFEMGISTASTLVAVANALSRNYLEFDFHNLVFVAPCVCLEQMEARLVAAAPGATLVVGTEWRYNDEPDSGERFYLNRMQLFGNSYTMMPPRDWGQCLTGGFDKVKDIWIFLNEFVRPLKAGDNQDSEINILFYHYLAESH